MPVSPADLIDINLFWHKALNCLIGDFSVYLQDSSLIRRRFNCRWSIGIVGLWWTVMDIEQWGFFSVQHLCYRGTSVYKVIYTCCRMFANRTITTCLSETPTPISRMWGNRSNQMIHRDSLIHNSSTSILSSKI